MSTIKWLILLFISVGIGTFVNQVMENIDVNVWVSRATGCLISAVIGLFLYKYFTR